MYNEYEESFYYEEPGSAGTDAAGEALGLGIGMGIGSLFWSDRTIRLHFLEMSYRKVEM